MAVSPNEQPIIDWANLPEGVDAFSLWDTLHDGDLLAVDSDLLGRTVTLRFSVAYVRDFHHLPESTRFTIVVEAATSVRAVRSVPWPGGCSMPNGISREEESKLIAEYHRKWREESLAWSDFEALILEEADVSDAALARGAQGCALHLGLIVASDSYIEAWIRGGAATFYVAEKRVTAEKFVALGAAYWEAFARRSSDNE